MPLIPGVGGGVVAGGIVGEGVGVGAGVSVGVDEGADVGVAVGIDEGDGADVRAGDGVGVCEETDVGVEVGTGEVTGAGDTALAAFAAVRTLGCSSHEIALKLANELAGEVCMQRVTAVPAKTLKEHGFVYGVQEKSDSTMRKSIIRYKT